MPCSFAHPLAGMRPLEPGFCVIEFKPENPTQGLGGVSPSYESVRGTVVARWKRTAAGLRLDVTVPPNATGRVYAPAPNPQAVTEAGEVMALIPAGRREVIDLAWLPLGSAAAGVL